MAEPEYRIFVGDALDMALEDESVDAIVCDPPYGLEFMGKDWDSFRTTNRAKRWSGDRSGASGSFAIPKGLQMNSPLPSYGGQRPMTSRCLTCGKRDAFRNGHDCGDKAEWIKEPVTPNAAPPAMLAFQNWTEQWGREAMRVLKPGGHLLAFGGTRTYHRVTCGLEDAGFEIRDCIIWLYGSGFPKSRDVSKAIDKLKGVERPIIGWWTPAGSSLPIEGKGHSAAYTRGVNTDEDEERRLPEGTRLPVTGPATPEAIQWDGWGTTLKPAYEPVVVARKPLTQSVAENVMQYGTGALNIDGTRIGNEERHNAPSATNDSVVNLAPRTRGEHPGTDVQGRWPANVVLDEEAARMMDEQVGDLGGGSKQKSDEARMAVYPDAGGPSRFFYTAKASKTEREAGLDQFDEALRSDGREADSDVPNLRRNLRRNDHPTVKPVDLMRYLIRLVTPPAGTVLDPFTGSGSTGMAALDEGMNFIGIDQDEHYVKLAEARIKYRHKYEDDPVEATTTMPQGRLF